MTLPRQDRNHFIKKWPVKPGEMGQKWSILKPNPVKTGQTGPSEREMDPFWD